MLLATMATGAQVDLDVIFSTTNVTFDQLYQQEAGRNKCIDQMYIDFMGIHDKIPQEIYSKIDDVSFFCF